MTSLDVAPKLHAWLTGRHAQTQDLLLRFAAIDGPSGDPDALADSTAFLVDHLGRLGARVIEHRTPAGTHIEAHFGERKGAGGGTDVLILCHYDTVWPRGTA